MDYRSASCPVILGNTGYFPFVVTNSSDQAADADSTPSATLYIGSDIDARSSGKTMTVTKVSGETGQYNASYAITAGNGFSAGDRCHIVIDGIEISSSARPPHFIDFPVA